MLARCIYSLQADVSPTRMFRMGKVIVLQFMYVHVTVVNMFYEGGEPTVK